MTGRLILIEVISAHRERPLSLCIGLMPLPVSNKPGHGHATSPRSVIPRAPRGVAPQAALRLAGLFTDPHGKRHGIKERKRLEKSRTNGGSGRRGGHL
jgi:hypothetical protein